MVLGFTANFGVGRVRGGARRTRFRQTADVAAGEGLKKSVDAPDSLVDVAVVGGGPAGFSLARALGERGVSVTLVDKDLDRKWPNNYGVWMDELEKARLDDCVKIAWPKASVFTDEEKQVMDRPYGRVDVVKAKKKMRELCEQSGNVRIIDGIASKLDHQVDRSTVTIQETDSDEFEVKPRVVVDATGHALRFIKFTEGHAPGIQTAYGMEITVKSHNYPLNEMLLMDFRSNHMKDTAKDRQLAEDVPLFFYVMPMSETRIFVEETSLIARPSLDFDFLREQCYKRLEHHGIEVLEVHEEEFCYIPMGGGMPLLNQRVVGFGGTAGLVHPATGYMFGNATTRAEEVADAIKLQLQDPSKDGISLSRSIWKSIWSDTRLLQRDFLVFGGEMILRMKLSQLQTFFNAFFRLPRAQWTEFLSFGLQKPEERLVFGLNMFVRTTNALRLRLMSEAIVHGQMTLIKSVIPNPFKRPDSP